MPGNGLRQTSSPTSPRTGLPSASTTSIAIRGALGEQHRAPERVPAHDFPGAHDPAHVGHEVDDLAGLGVCLVGDLARDRDEEPALDVDDALRLAGRA